MGYDLPNYLSPLRPQSLLMTEMQEAKLPLLPFLILGDPSEPENVFFKDTKLK